MITKRTINITDNYQSALREKVSAEVNKMPKGFVGIYDKLPTGDLKLIERKNLIVYQGREWLLQRAFGPELQGAGEEQYRYIKWFGLGTGGGEAGNPLQAGATQAWDTDLYDPILLKPSGTSPTYAPRMIAGSQVDGYYKEFSDVVRKEDRANPYIVDSTEYYPELIAEIRIEVASDEGNGIDGSGYSDLNEAALFIDDPSVYNASSSSVSYSLVVDQIVQDGNDTKYIFPKPTDISDVSIGDYLSTNGSGLNAGNLISHSLITDVGYEDAQCNAFITVTNPTGSDQGPGLTNSFAYVEKRLALADIAMFSRVTFSTIRKTIDREIVFLWKIYF